MKSSSKITILWLRRVAAATTLISFTALFTGLSGAMAKWLCILAGWEFVPALLAGNFIIAGGILLMTILVGRLYCGMCCPLGILQDVAWRIKGLGPRAKGQGSRDKGLGSRDKGLGPRDKGLGSRDKGQVPSAKGQGEMGKRKNLSLGAWPLTLGPWPLTLGPWPLTLNPIVRYSILAAALVVGLCGLGYSWLEPYGIFGRGISAATLNMPVWAMVTQIGLLVVIFGLAVWKGRVWCNWICPVGTLLGVCSIAAPLGLKIDPKKCIGCKKCERSCRASAIKIIGKGEGGKIDKTKCVQCRDCTVLCPTEAIDMPFKRRDNSALNHIAPPAPHAPQPLQIQPHTKPYHHPHHPNTPTPQPPQPATLTRREFIIGSTAIGATLAAKAADEKIFDGGFAAISDPGIDKRNAPLKPAGSHSIKNFQEKCVACQLCVQMCPNHVLRPSMSLKDFMQPEMAFDKGFCPPDCTRCSQVCPAGAITPITYEQKLYTHIGEAVWHKDRCLAATEGVNCTACFRHCPTRAISLVRNDDGVMIPVVDTFDCMGCGACEHVCPARPLPGMTVRALVQHREHARMSESDALYEAISLIEKDGKACVIIRDGIFTIVKDGRGVSPLLEILDTDPSAMKDAYVVDKVIGRAAAAICIVGGAKSVYGVTTSSEGAAFLTAHKIPCEASNTVPRILNREKNGICPLEEACLGLNDPEKMVAAIRAKLEELKK